MRYPPMGPDLLTTAREVMKEQVLPQLDGDDKYLGLMIVNAMGIATRQMSQGEAPEEHERQALATLLGANAGDDASLVDLSRRLSEAIRRGECDPGQPMSAPAWSQLWESAAQRVRESRPGYLKSLGLE